LSRWTEHYTKALNHRPSSELDAQQLQAADDPDTSVDVLTIQEVRAAITKLKFGHAAGRDAVAPEMLKQNNQPMFFINCL